MTRLGLALLCCAHLSLAAALARAQDETPAETAANARRIRVLAAAAGITDVQAATVFDQMTPAPHVPRIHDVVTDTLADGGRNIFGLMDIDTRHECSIEGLGPDMCASHGVQTWIFFTHVSAAGAVERTGFDLPFGTMPRSAPLAHAVALHLFAPSPSAPRIAYLDGLSGHGASYEHSASVWDGRRGYELFGARGAIEQPRSAGDDANLISIAIDEAGRRFVTTSLWCDDGCRCTVPRGPADEAAQLARNVAAHPGVCRTTERVTPFPPDLHLVDDDVDADAVHGTEAEVTAAIVPDLARASGLTVAQAAAAMPRLPMGAIAPRFSSFVTVTAADGTRTAYGIAADRFRDACVLRSRAHSRYDAIRACASNTTVAWNLVTIQLSRAGEVTDADAHMTTGEVAALYVTRTPTGTPVPRVEIVYSAQRSLGGWAYADYVEVGFGQATVSGANDDDGHSAEGVSYVGELVPHPVGGSFVTLTRRQTVCSAACPCAPPPHTMSDAHALLDARQRARNPACPVLETAFAPP